MSEVNYKEIIKQEYIKCATDPVYFMKKYCYIQHPQRGRLLFNLYPFQDKVLKYWKENKYNIVLKSRQLGISTLAAGYALWLMIFHKDKNVICIATKQETAKNMVVKTKFMFDELPSWLKIGLVDKNGEPWENNKLNLKFYNGSQIKASSAASDAGRSEAVSLLIIDEAAFIDNVETIWASAWNTVSTGGQALLLSTPNGTGNWFHKMWTKATLKENEFLPIKLSWTVHPERDEKWRKEQDDVLGERLAAQECFSGDVIIYTKNGPKNIRDIKINDEVLTHKGNYKRVIRTFSHLSKDVFEIKGGLNNIKKYVTKNHPFYNKDNEWLTTKEIYENKQKIQLFPKAKYNKKEKLVDLAQFIKADNPEYFPLKKDENYIWLTKTHKCNRYIKFDYDLGFFIGCFMSEGSLSLNKVEISFNGKTERKEWPLELERILLEKFNFNKICYYNSKIWEGSSKFYIKSQIIKNFIELCIEGGKYCHQKHLSSFVYQNANIDCLRGIMDGILIGDGMLKKEYDINLISTSEKLIYDVLYISHLLNIHNVSIKSGFSINPKDNTKIKPNYTLTWLNSKINSDIKIFSERIKLTQINKIRKYSKFEFINKKPLVSLKLSEVNKEIEVFNFEVEDHHSYITEYGITHNCDCDFSTSGDTVFHSDLLKFYENTFIKEPSEKRGINKDLWVWDPVDYMKNYMIVADVARGDGKDYSAFHVIDIEDNIQVAEYKGQLPPKEFAKLLNSISTEYNNGLLIVESNNVGWSVLEQLIEMNYDNLYYSPKGGDVHMTAESYGNKYNNPEALTPGFYMSLKNRVLVIGKFEEFVREKSVTIRSRRLLEEMKTFIWKGGRQEAQNGCNDDLVIPFATGMYLRDTSFRFKKENQELQQAALQNMKKTGYTGVYTNSNNRNPYLMNVRGMPYDFSWLINKKQNG